MENILLTSLTQYAGIDWMAMILTFVAIYLIGNKARSGLMLMIAGNACWVVLGFMSVSAAMIVANIIFAAMNLRAFLKWSNDSEGEAALD